MEDDTWYTRQQGSDRWISLAPDRFQGTRVKLDAEAADNDDWPERGDAVVSADSGSDGPGSTAADEEEQAEEELEIKYTGTDPPPPPMIALGFLLSASASSLLAAVHASAKLLPQQSRLGS